MVGVTPTPDDPLAYDPHALFDILGWRQNTMRKQKILAISITLVILLAMAVPSFNVSAAGTSPTVNVAGSFSVIAATTVTNVPTSSISGSVGVYSGSTDPGLTAAQVGGTIYLADAQALAAKSDAQAAFTNLNLQDCDTNYAGTKDLGGMNLVAGVYCAGSFHLTGVLTLSGSGVWIFKSASDIITAPDSSVVGGDPCNVWWTAVSSVTLDLRTHFIGTGIASTSITMNTGATLNGRIWALTGQVSLQSNTITGPTCSASASTPPTVTTTATGPVTVGDNITDTAHLGGGSGTLSGAITFDVFAPGDSTCATPLTALTPVAVTGGGNYTSGNFATADSGRYRWKAHYSGDPNNTNVNTACNDPNETSTVNAKPAALPGTGFAPHRATLLSAQPAAQSYADLGDLWLEIPRLDVQMPIVGVPQANGQWDVSWLGNDAGWLNGTAFPTYSGNSVLAGHVYNADGTPGPFVHLNGLWWGDQVIVHAWGAQYVYEVRTVMQVSPFATSSVIMHKDLPWVTLVTCRGYDEASNSYEYRVAVGAVLVEVK